MRGILFSFQEKEETPPSTVPHQLKAGSVGCPIRVDIVAHADFALKHLKKRHSHKKGGEGEISLLHKTRKN